MSEKKVSPEDYLKDIDLETEYGVVALQLEEQNLKCKVYGNAGVICEPCPLHPNVKFDGIYLDLTLAPTWKCIKDNSDVDNLPVTFADSPNIQTVLKKQSKIKSDDQKTFRSSIIERHYLTNNLILSLHTGDKDDQESYKAYIYVPEEGIYRALGAGEIKKKVQVLYEDFFGPKPTLPLVTEMKNRIHVKTEHGGTEEIFSWDKGTVYYLPGRIRDIEINIDTGEVKILEKDPVSRPFLKRMPYDFTEDPPISIPDELAFIYNYTTPRFAKNVLSILAKAVVYRGADMIFFNMSRVHNTGKTAFIEILREIAGDVVTEIRTKHLYGEFVESKFLNKTLLVIDEYKGLSEYINDELKHLASKDATISADRKFKEHIDARGTLAIIINTNKLRISEANLEDSAFMKRVIVTPFTHVWKEDRPHFDQKTREKIVLWVAKNLVPAFLSGKLRPDTYPVNTIASWVKNNGEPPDRIEEFLRLNAYKEYNANNTLGHFVPSENVYRFYQLWCDRTDTFPATDEEFYTKLKYIAIRDGAWIVEKDHKEGLFLRKKGLELFL